MLRIQIEAIENGYVITYEDTVHSETKKYAKDIIELTEIFQLLVSMQS